MSNNLQRSDLWSLEEYAEKRPQYRREVMQHKKNRRLALDENLSLYFEDRMTIRYQIQEMLRIEKMFDVSGIQDELDAYNPLIPDGTNLKATLMLEFEDEDERRERLSRLLGIEHTVWIRVDDLEKVYAIADEDLERSNEEKTSAVHFLRFELTPTQINRLHQGGGLSFGVDHELLRLQIVHVEPAIRRSLIADLEPVSVS